MAREQDVFQLPVRFFDYTRQEDFALAVQRCFLEIERMLRQLQMYVKQATGGAVKDLPSSAEVWNRAANINPDGTFSSEKLVGAIETLRNEIIAGRGVVTITDDDGILIVDDKDNPTKALRLLGGTLAIANEKDANGKWLWRTFGTGDGFVADEITTGVLNAAAVSVVGKDASGNPVVQIGHYETLGDQTATFSRSSVAYKSDGAQVAANVPRFEAGKFGQGVMVEEGTSNLVKTNAGADPLFNSSTGWTLTNATIANGVLTLQSPDGVAVAMASCTLTNLAQNTKHSFLIRARYKDTSGTAQPLILDLYASGYDNAEQELDISTSQLTNAFQNFKKDGFDSQLAPASVQLRIFTFSTRPIEVEFVQLEQKAYATTVTDGTRSPESLTIPTAGVFQKGNWTVKLRYTPTSAANLGDVVKYLWSLYIDANNRYEIIIGWYGDLVLKVFSGGTGYVIGTAFNYIVPGNDYYITVCGDGSKIRLFVNGAQIGTDTTYVEPVGTLPTNMYIGCAWNGTGQANGIISDFAVMSRAQTLAEHQAEYQTGLPLEWNEDTTYLMSCNGHLQPTVRRFGLWAKNGEISLVAPPVEGGIRVYDAQGNLRTHIGQYAPGKYGAKVINGEIYSTSISTGMPGDTNRIELSAGFAPLIVYFQNDEALEMYAVSSGGYLRILNPTRETAVGWLCGYDDVTGYGLALEGFTGTGFGPLRLTAAPLQMEADYISIDGRTTNTDVTIWGDLLVTGTLSAGGSKPARQVTENYGERYLYARESPDVRYIIEGRAQLINGECRIILDPIFLECIEPDSEGTPWLIHLTPYANANLYVAEYGPDYILVRGPIESNCFFAWSLSAIRKGYAGRWLEQPSSDDDGVLTSNWEDDLGV